MISTNMDGSENLDPFYVVGNGKGFRVRLTTNSKFSTCLALCEGFQLVEIGQMLV